MIRIVGQEPVVELARNRRQDLQPAERGGARAARLDVEERTEMLYGPMMPRVNAPPRKRRGVIRRLRAGDGRRLFRLGTGRQSASSDGGVDCLDGPRRASGVPSIPVRSVGTEGGIMAG